ncbi:GDSL-like Lipase/Acylhydrolase family [Rhodospirillales bacterium URHD0017]|nr:GDSL-like Lipase/Acylhydrolase family [Rhodospirillales bacterium URHD0017]
MKVALNLLLILVASLLCLFAAEGLTRLVLDDGMLYELEMWKYAREVKMRDPRPDLGHRHRPQAEARLMNVDVRTDSRGLRGPEIADTPANGTARIAFVGDSITMGWGVAEKETFAHQVIEGLAKAGRKVDGFNLGVGNYNTLQELTLFREVGAPLKPDIIVLAYFINDAEPMPSYTDNGWLTEHSAAWVVADYRFDSLFRRFGEAPDWKHYYRDLYEPKAAGWLQTQKALGQFATTARELGARIIVFNIPELRELRPYPFADITAKVRAVVEKDGMPFVDLLPTVETLEPASLWVTVPDPHPNGKAEITFARGMISDLMPMLDELCRTKGKGCSAP